jgi:hypothetical protein
MLLIPVIDQRIEARNGFGDDVAALPAIAAIRPAKFDKLFPAERHAAVSAIAGADIDLGLIEEFHAADPDLARNNNIQLSRAGDVFNGMSALSNRLI